MADIHSKSVRSYNMSRIRSKNTKPELLVRKHLFKDGFRYRINVKSLPGKPDIVLSKYNTVIFVNGCFWHGHEGCKYFVIPKSRTEWWTNKIYKTKENEKKNKMVLKQMGWNIITVWECQLKKENIEKTLKQLSNKLYSNFLDQYKI